MWRPPGYATADLWADACRHLPAGSPFPGPWDTDRTPYLRTPMRAFADPAIEYVVLMLARQMGKTEFGFNVLGWMWESAPAPAMWVTPTQKLAYSIARDRIYKMLRTCGTLWDRLDKRYAKPGSLERWVSGVRFGISWAGSPTELSSHPNRIVLVDERSRMVTDAGSEGDPVQIVKGGTDMFPDATIGIMSSPLDEETCPTYRWWLTGSKMRWCWRCPDCGEWLVPCLANARYPEKASYEVIKVEAWMECPTCEHAIRDEDRLKVEADYQPCVVTDEGDVQLAPGLEVRNSVASYWATGFASPRRGIGDIMERYARAQRDELGDDPEETLRGVVTASAGELWKSVGEGADPLEVRSCQRTDVPEGIQLVTAGVDVQQDSLYFVVRGWTHGSTSMLLEHDQIHGATEFDDVWLKLATALEGRFCGLPVHSVLIDSGHNTAQVYAVCDRHVKWQPARGHDRSTARPVYASNVPVSPTGRAMKTIKLWHINGDHWKTWLYSRIAWDKDQAGAWFVPSGVGDDYCAQVTNERVRIRRGKRVWYETGNRQNHYLDCEVLAAAAAEIQGVRRLPAKVRTQSPDAPPPPRPRPDPRLQRREL